jgi:hypothetical protein
MSTVAAQFVGSGGAFTVYPATDTVAISVPEIENTTTNGTTGSLQVVLWYTSIPYSGGAISGYNVASIPYFNVLGPGQYFVPASFTEAYSRPPDGTWYPTLALEEYDGSTGSYEIINWLNYQTPEYVGAVPISFQGSASFNSVGDSVSIAIPEIVNSTATGTTGSIEVVLWATSSPYTGSGPINGYQTATVTYQNTLGPGQYFDPFTTTTGYTPPPNGDPYYTLALEEFDGTSDVIEGYLNFSAPTTPTTPTTPTGPATPTLPPTPSHLVKTFSDPEADYTVKYVGGGVADVTPNGGTETTVSGYEVLQFSDKPYFIESGDNANIARLYSAALDRLPDLNGLFSWEDIYANNVGAAAKAAGVYQSLAETSGGYAGSLSIADGFVDSPEFIAKYGSLSNTAFVTQLYANVLDRAPDAAGLASWLNLMTPGNSSGTTYTQGMVLVGFAESPENISKTSSWLVDMSRSG